MNGSFSRIRLENCRFHEGQGEASQKLLIVAWKPGKFSLKMAASQEEVKRVRDMSYQAHETIYKLLRPDIPGRNTSSRKQWSLWPLDQKLHLHPQATESFHGGHVGGLKQWKVLHENRLLFSRGEENELFLPSDNDVTRKCSILGLFLAWKSAERRILCLNFVPFHDCLLSVWVIL